MNFLKIPLFLILLTGAGHSLADYVNYATISRVNVHAESGTIYVFTSENSNRWILGSGADHECSPSQIVISGALTHSNAVLSVLLSAYHSGKRVRFIGNGCSSSTTSIFHADYVSLQD
ncbi:Uncharacterised protein [BD1-7 clade bacterium]|uniref:Uncharacterized protein n=1 Tax=BD1-7 clade bacterium TaxID=2029982 RepID=A0A5S9Q2N4_9GAMM|nr:Uncharacterised protein [BD1-7 clade bacterium]CAA0111998.1 Uncharacterised protein [BD1-7 clade bacterium]